MVNMVNFMMCFYYSKNNKRETSKCPCFPHVVNHKIKAYLQQGKQMESRYMNALPSVEGVAN